MPLAQEPFIHVGILASESIHFELNGDFKTENQLVPGGKYAAIINGNQVSIGITKQPYILLKPIKDSSTFLLKKVKIGIGFHWEQKEDQAFKGSLLLQVENGRVRAINIVKLENYLESVISSEMSAMNDLTLLKAHAIVSRSWLLAQIHNKGKCHPDDEEGSTPNNDKQIPRRFASLGMTQTLEKITKWYDREDHETFDVCADDHCQRYQGITKAISENAHRAVSETSGQVLMYNSEICDARFSKCCGGITENFENVWQPVKVPYLTSITDNINLDKFQKTIRIEDFIQSSPEAFCNTSDPEILSQVLIDFDQKTTDFYRWTKTYSQEELSSLLEKKSGIHFGQIIDMVPIKRGLSGRIIQLKIVGSNRQVIVGKELEIRKWLSDSHLYSSAFVVERKFDRDKTIPSTFTLKGAGWGHGVGMCQIGAAVMSHRGYTSEEILSHYFQSASLNKLY